jgi:hypothetical protein
MVKEIKEKPLKQFLTVAEITLVVSSAIDMVLWFTNLFLVPSFVVSLMSIGSCLLLAALKKLI